MSEFKLDPIDKVNWLAALRSGDYQQGRDCLRYGDRYCCLGVFADVARLGKWSSDPDVKNLHVGEDAYHTQLPHSVIPPDVQETLMTLNDGENDNGDGSRSFTEIADWIEANL